MRQSVQCGKVESRDHQIVALMMAMAQVYRRAFREYLISTNVHSIASLLVAEFRAWLERIDGRSEGESMWLAFVH